MTAEKLYALYVKAMANQGCEVDTWDELGELDRAAWQCVVDALGEVG